MKLIADNSLCQAHGMCVLEDEEIFNLDSDGYISIGEGIEIPTSHEESVTRGVEACPVEALRLE